MKYFKGIVLSILLGVLLFSFSAQARRVKFYSIPQLQNGEVVIQASDGAMFTFKLNDYSQDDRFPGRRYVVSVLNESGIEIAWSCFRGFMKNGLTGMRILGLMCFLLSESSR